jgi:hypothetical protein
MPGPLIVIATCAGQRLALAVKVLTGAGGPGAIINNGATTATLTPVGTGSRVYGVSYCFGGHPSAPGYSPYSAATTMILDTWSANTGEAVAFGSASPTTANVPVTLGVQPTGGESGPVTALCEITASGTIAEDPSSPPPLPGPAPSNSALAIVLSLSTAAFTPPAGSWLVAMTAAQLTSAITVSDSSGLTWTQDVTIATSLARASVWTAQVPGSAGPPVLQRYVVDAPAAMPWPVIPAGTPSIPAALQPGTGGPAGRGNAAISAGAGIYPQSLLPGQVVVLDPAGAVYAAISAVCTLRPYVQGQDDRGGAGLSN